MRTLEDLQLELEQTSEMVRTLMLDSESKSELMSGLEEIAASIAIIQSMVQRGRLLLSLIQELALSHSSSQTQH